MKSQTSEIGLQELLDYGSSLFESNNGIAVVTQDVAVRAKVEKLLLQRYDQDPKLEFIGQNIKKLTLYFEVLRLAGGKKTCEKMGELIASTENFLHFALAMNVLRGQDGENSLKHDDGKTADLLFELLKTGSYKIRFADSTEMAALNTEPIAKYELISVLGRSARFENNIEFERLSLQFCQQNLSIGMNLYDLVNVLGWNGGHESLDFLVKYRAKIPQLKCTEEVRREALENCNKAIQNITRRLDELKLKSNDLTPPRQKAARGDRLKKLVK